MCYCRDQGSARSLQPLLVCVSGAELQVNATGYHNHGSGSLTLFCVSVRPGEGGCFEGEQVVIWCLKTEGESRESVFKREKKKWLHYNGKW